MSGPNPPDPESFGDEPVGEPLEDEHTQDAATDTGFSQAYSAPESEQFISGPYVPADLALYDYDTYDPASEYDEEPPTPPRWPWIVGVAAILAAVALVASVSLLVFPSLTSNEAAPTTTTPAPPPVQDEITTTTPPPPPPTSETPPPPPPTETVTVTSEPPPPPPSTEAPPPARAPSSAPSAPATTSAAPPAATTTTSGPRQVTYTVTGTKAPGDIISITFTDSSGRSRTQRNVYIPWSFTLTPISNSEVGSVEASSLFRVSRLNCAITASDGTVLSQRSDNSPVTSC